MDASKSPNFSVDMDPEQIEYREIKPVVILHNDLINKVIFKTFKKSYQIHYSHELLPYTCYFPASAATFLLIDFTNDFQHWTLDENYDAEKIKWLSNFVNDFEGANVVYLCSKVDEFLISVSYDIQRSVELITGKSLTTGFASSWKAAANYIKEVAVQMSLESMEQEQTYYQHNLEHLRKMNVDLSS